MLCKVIGDCKELYTHIATITSIITVIIVAFKTSATL